MEELNENTIYEKENKKDEEISLIDLVAVLWRRKWLILGITLAGMIYAIIYSVISIKLPPEKSYLPNLYTPKAQMLITDDSKGGANLGSFGALAGMAGVNLSSGFSNSALAKYLVSSNPVLDSIIDQFGFMEKWNIEKSPVTKSRNKVKGKLKTTYDDNTKVFTISYEDKDARLARDVVNYVVVLLEQKFNELGVDKNKLQKSNLEENINNAYQEILSYQAQIRDLESSVSNVYSGSSVNAIMMDTSLLKMELSVQEGIYKQLKTQYETLKVTMATEKPVFQILEMAEIPDQKSGPSRGKICIIYSFVAAFISVFLAFLLEALENLKKNPETIAKLKGKK